MGGISLQLHYRPNPNSEEELDSKLDEKPGQHVAYSERQAFDIVDRYLHGIAGADIDSAALTLLDMMPDREQYYHSRSGVPGMLVGLICDVAQQIPYDHPFQSTFLALAKEPSLATKLYPVRESLGMALVESDNDDFEESIVNPEPFGGHMNLTAFKARLVTAGVWLWPATASSMLSDVLETRRTGEIDIDSARIGAAAMWILYSGPAVFDFLLQEHPKTSFASGPLYKGPAFGVKRWRFWAKAFEDAVEHIHEEPQKLALRAASLMHTMERNVSH